MRRSAATRLAHIRLALLGVVLLPLLALAPSSPAVPGHLRAAAGGRLSGSQGHAQQPAPGQSSSSGSSPHVHPDSRGGARPQLRLTWPAGTRETHAGVPTPLTIQALDAAGRPDGSRGGTALVLVDDARARVAPARAAAMDAPLPGTPVRTGLRVPVPLSAGTATVTVTFVTPGQHTLLATMADDIEVAGESEPPLQVHDTFLAVQGAAAMMAGGRQRFTVAAQDDQGRPVPGYTGAVRLTTSDPGASVRTVGAAEGRADGTAAHQITPAEQGRTAFDIAFAGGGAQTVEAVDADNPWRRATLTVAVAGGTAAPISRVAPSPTAAPTPPASPAATATAAAPATATAGPSAPATPTARTSVTATPTATAAATASARTATSSSAPALPVPFAFTGLSTLLTANPSFSVTLSAASTNAGVPLTMTVQALDAAGQPNPAYTGTVQFTSPDMAFAPGTGYRYTFTTGTGADNGQHAFPVTFNTAGSAQTITVTDTVTTVMTGTSPAVAVAETYLSATFAAGTVVQGTSVNLTVQAKDGSGALVAGYRGRVKLTSTWDGVRWYEWGTPELNEFYSFTTTDAGSRTLTPKFTYAGDQTVTVTDTALAARTVTTSSIAVTNTPAAAFSHDSAPSGVKLADGSTLWAFLGIRGRLYVRRNVGTSAEPAWRPLVLVRDVTALPGQVGADTPALVRLGSTLALFHTYTDGTYYQAWLTTSTDSGATWSAPVKLTSEAGHIQRLAAVVSGGTVSLFWSRQDTNGRLFSQTSSDLVTWSAKATLSQGIGVPVAATTSNFGVARLASGSWVLGWMAASAVGEWPVAAGDLNYPTVHTATSADLVTWSAAQELTLAYSQRGAQSVALAQDPTTGTLTAAYDQYAYPWDYYLDTRTSTTGGTSWAAQQRVGYDRAGAANGQQGYTGRLPTLVAGSMTLGATVTVGSGQLEGYGNGYGLACWGEQDGVKGTVPFDLTATPMPEPQPLPITTVDPRGVDAVTGPCKLCGEPVDVVTGYESAAATDLAVAARGFPLVVRRMYTSYDGVAGATGAFGYGWSWGYGARALTHTDGSVTIVEGNGRRAHFWKSGASWTTDPHIYDTLAAATGGGYTLTRHDQTVWSFDSAGRLASIADRSGNALTLTYAGATLASISSAGRTLTVTSDANGHITAIAGPGGVRAAYTYDAGGHLATATDAAGATTTYTYDGRHQLLTVVDGNGHTVESNTYGTLGRVTAQVDAAGQRTTFTQTEARTTHSGGYASVTDPRGIETRYWFDGGLRLTQRDVYQPFPTLLRRQTWSYDAAGNLTGTTAGSGQVYDPQHPTASTYDSQGNVLTRTADAVTGGLNLQSRFTYSGTNDLLTVTDPLGHTSSFTYDSQGHRLTAADALGHTTTYAYDTQGQLTSATDATGRTVSFGYSAAGDLTAITVPGGAVWTLAYDAAGRVTSVTDPLGHVTTLAMDGLGRVTAVTNALSQTTSITYDAAGNRTRVTDALGRSTAYGYDARNRLTTVTDALNQVTTYAYDPNSNLTSVTNALGRVWQYSYDGLNRLATAKDPLNTTTSYSYDWWSNVTQVQRPDGTVNRFVYDAVNRLTGVDLRNDSSLDLQYAYDAAGRRTSMTDGTGTTTYAYDLADRLTSTTAPVTGTVAYGYDTANRRTSLTYPSGHQVTYGYTTRGELASVTDWTSGVTTYSYDPAGRLTGIALPNGVSSTLGYDPADRLTAITHARGGTTLEAIQYALNAVGNRTSMTDAAGTTTWGYDALDRLTAAAYPNADTVSYGYDAAGNRTTHTVNGVSKTNTFDAANRMTASGADSYSYDANGNQTGRTAGGVTTTYTYDALDRLTAIGGPVPAGYTYNGDGLRVGKTVSGATTSYAWDPTGLPVVLSDGNEYVWGAGLISQVTASGTKTYAHSDGLGSIRLLTDSAGTVVGTRQYDAFGTARAQTGAQLPFGYTGEQADAESGLVYLRARYYDPSSGRFLTQDPLFQGRVSGVFGSQALNLYGYVRSNPVNSRDPRGTCDENYYLDCDGPGGYGSEDNANYIPGGAQPGVSPWVRLYRVVNTAEAVDILDHGFRITERTMSGKMFWENEEHALKFADQMCKSGVEAPDDLWIVSIEIPLWLFAKMERIQGVDGIGNAKWADVDMLDEINRWATVRVFKHFKDY